MIKSNFFLCQIKKLNVIKQEWNYSTSFNNPNSVRTFVILHSLFIPQTTCISSSVVVHVTAVVHARRVVGVTPCSSHAAPHPVTHLVGVEAPRSAVEVVVAPVGVRRRRRRKLLVVLTSRVVKGVDHVIRGLGVSKLVAVGTGRKCAWRRNVPESDPRWYLGGRVGHGGRGQGLAQERVLRVGRFSLLGRVSWVRVTAVWVVRWWGATNWVRLLRVWIFSRWTFLFCRQNFGLYTWVL